MITHRRILIGLAACIALAATTVAQTASNFNVLEKKADAARDAGQINEAVDLYQKALRLKPDWRQGWWVLGSLLYDANRFQEGEQAFLPLTKLDPNKSPGWAMAGLCEFEIKHYRDALQNLERADKLGLPPALYDVNQYHIILILIRGGQFDSAIEAISRYASRGKDNPKLIEAMGVAALRRPVLPTDIAPADHDLVVALGRAMCDAAASRGKEATAEFDVILASYPNALEVHYLAGMVLLQSDPDKALAAFNAELALSPKHSQSLISIAAEYVRRGDYKTARTYAERAVASNPDYFAAHAMLGKAMVEGDLDLTRGINELETAVKMAPANPQSRLALAAAYAKVGRKEDAAKQRKEFLRLRAEVDASEAEPK
jgi:tetratricopeptide (TPR) repeat protein